MMEDPQRFNPALEAEVAGDARHPRVARRDGCADRTAARTAGGDERGRRGLERLRAITLLFDQAFGDSRHDAGVSVSTRCSASCPGSATSRARWSRCMRCRWRGSCARRRQIQAAHAQQHRARCARSAPCPSSATCSISCSRRRRAISRCSTTGWRRRIRPRAAAKRGLLLMPIAIIIVFATLTVLGIWMLFILFHWLFTLGS